MPVAAIILAAGASRRLGRPKQLLEFRGETLLARTIRLAKESGASPVIVVLGAQFENISASIERKNEIVVRNEEWAQGIATSIHAGMRAMDANAKDASGVLILGCDQPRLTADHLRSLIALFESQAEAIDCRLRLCGCRGYSGSFSAHGVYGIACAERRSRRTCIDREERPAQLFRLHLRAAMSISICPRILLSLGEIQRSMVASMYPCGSSIGTKM